MECDLMNKLDDIIHFISDYTALINSQVTGAYVLDYFDAIPDSWFQELDSFSYDDIIQLQNVLSKVYII